MCFAVTPDVLPPLLPSDNCQRQFLLVAMGKMGSGVLRALRNNSNLASTGICCLQIDAFTMLMQWEQFVHGHGRTQTPAWCGLHVGREG